MTISFVLSYESTYSDSNFLNILFTMFCRSRRRRANILYNIYVHCIFSLISLLCRTFFLFSQTSEYVAVLLFWCLNIYGYFWFLILRFLPILLLRLLSRIDLSIFYSRLFNNWGVLVLKCIHSGLSSIFIAYI